MAGIPAGKEQITFQLPTEQGAYIAKRAERLNWTKARFMGRLIDTWLEKGAFPVHETDELLPRLPYKAKGRHPGTTSVNIDPAAHAPTETERKR